jgi:hypothetical protein
MYHQQTRIGQLNPPTSEIWANGRYGRYGRYGLFPLTTLVAEAYILRHQFPYGLVVVGQVARRPRL